MFIIPYKGLDSLMGWTFLLPKKKKKKLLDKNFLLKQNVTKTTIPITANKVTIPAAIIPGVFPSNGLPVALNFNVDVNFGIGPVRLLFETSRSCRSGKVAKLSGMEPVKLLSFRYRVLNDVRFAMAGEIVPTKPSFPKFHVGNLLLRIAGNETPTNARVVALPGFG
jgi:hypothetical protein